MPLPSQFTYPSEDLLPSDPSGIVSRPPTVELPQFDLPFRFEQGQLAVVEQDTADDVQNQIMTVVLCPIGYRDENPAFGITPPVFQNVPLDTRDLHDAVDEWVPDVACGVEEFGDPINEATRSIQIHIEENDLT